MQNSRAYALLFLRLGTEKNIENVLWIHVPYM